MEQYMHSELLLLLLIFSPVIVTAQQGSQKEPWDWEGTVILLLSFIFLVIIGVVALIVRWFGSCFLGGGRATVDHHHQHQGKVVARGMDAAGLAALPSLKYSEIKMRRLGQGELECAVCLHEFKDSETLCLLPDCCHVFHPDCIAPWLASHVTCPVCRACLKGRQGSSVSVSSMLERISSTEFAASDHHLDHDDHVTVEIEGSSSKVDQSSTLEEGSREVRSMGRLPRCHTTGELLVRVVVEGDIGPNLSTMWPKETCPKSDYRVNSSKPNLNKWGCH